MQPWSRAQRLPAIRSSRGQILDSRAAIAYAPSMMKPMSLILQDPVLRATTLAVLFYGGFIGSIAPYQSLVGVRRLGLPNGVYALVLVTAAVVAVSASILIGVATDRGLSRRRAALVSAGATLCGALLMIVAPGRPSFVLVHALILPGATLFGQFFAIGRIASRVHSPADQDAVMAVIRAMLALAFVAVAPVWSAVLSAGGDLLWIYPGLAVLAVGMLLSVLALPDRIAGDRPSGQSFRASLSELARPEVVLRVALLGGITAAITAYLVLIGLIFGQAGRPEGDVALFVGGVAGMEVPFMLALPLALRLASRRMLIAGGAVIYGGWLAALPWLAGSAWVWFLILPAALGGAAVLTLPIAYLQDLLSDRPGAGASLIALQKVTGDGACALAFVAGTALSGYGLAAVLAAGLACAGGLGLAWVDRHRR